MKVVKPFQKHMKGVSLRRVAYEGCTALLEAYEGNLHHQKRMRSSIWHLGAYEVYQHSRWSMKKSTWRMKLPTFIQSV